MNAKALIPLIAGLGIGGLALKLGIDTLKQAKAGQEPTATVQVWAPVQDIPRGTAIREEMLQPLEYPESLVPEGAFTEQEELVGRVPQIAAPSNVPVLEKMLTPAGTLPGIHVKAGYRAVAVKIDASSGVDYHLEPGSWVDVVGSFKISRVSGSRRIQETVARTIIENVEVAAVGEKISPDTGTEEEDQSRGGRARSVRAVVLFVRPEEAKILLLAEQRGRIKLALRGNNDDSIIGEDALTSDMELTGELEEQEEDSEPEPEPVVAATVMQPQNVTAQAQKEQPKTWPVQIFSGGKLVQAVTFESRESSKRVPGEQAATPQRTPSKPEQNKSAAGKPVQQPPAPEENEPVDPGVQEEPEELSE